MRRMERMSYGMVRVSRLPKALFAALFLGLMLASGIHQGLIVLMNAMDLSEMIQPIVPILYWGLVSLGAVLLIRNQMKATFEEPLQKLAVATRKVAEGDFSVYVPTFHTEDQYDYLDVMILDFNKMVAELGSIETLKTDFFSNVSHEIKTPLAVIQTNAELLQTGHLSEAQRRECTDTILQATRRLSNLITNMLKLNKLEKQTIRPAAEVYDVCAQLCSVAVQFSATHSAR